MGPTQLRSARAGTGATGQCTKTKGPAYSKGNGSHVRLCRHCLMKGGVKNCNLHHTIVARPSLQLLPAVSSLKRLGRAGQLAASTCLRTLWEQLGGSCDALQIRWVVQRRLHRKISGLCRCYRARLSVSRRKLTSAAASCISRRSCTSRPHIRWGPHMRSSTAIRLVADSLASWSACDLQLHSIPTKRTLLCQLQSMTYSCDGMPQDHLVCHDLGL